jgi:hypothetical protein
LGTSFAELFRKYSHVEIEVEYFAFVNNPLEDDYIAFVVVAAAAVVFVVALVDLACSSAMAPMLYSMRQKVTVD